MKVIASENNKGHAALTRFKPMFYFYAPVKTSENQMLSGGKETEYWLTTWSN